MTKKSELTLPSSKVLLVEDIPANQLVATAILDYLGMQVDIAQNGQIAVEKVQNHTYDLILMDLQMPLMNGYEASRAIRALPNTTTLPIIAMTAAALPEDRQNAKNAGMNDHLAKPINLSMLETILHQWLAKPTQTNKH